MKKNSIFQGIILIGFGIYFLSPKLPIIALKEFQNWQSLLMLIGIAFLLQAYSVREYHYILPGTILLGFGIYYHHAQIFSFIPHGFSSMVLIIAAGMFLQYQKTKSGLIHAIILLAISLLFYFYNQFIHWIRVQETHSTYLWSYWPILLILFGLYFLAFKKTKK